jgi:hypothetical protein
MMRASLRFIGLAVLFCLAPSLSALQTDPFSIEELALQCPLIVRGTVAAKSCLRDPEGRIYTRVELDLAEVWKGSVATNRITIVHGGGTVGDRRVVVSGQVDYAPGEEVVAFLVLNPRGEGVTRGLAQGKFHVWKDPLTGELLAHNPFHGHPGPGARFGKSLLTGNGRTRLSLTELKRRVREIAR